MGEDTSRIPNISHNTNAAVIWRYRKAITEGAAFLEKWRQAQFAICATLHWKTASEELLTWHQDYLWNLVFQWLLRRCMKSTSMDDFQKENHCSQNGKKLQDLTLPNKKSSLIIAHVWRAPCQDYCVLPAVKHGGWRVLIWGCISAKVVQETFIDDTMNASLFTWILEWKDDNQSQECWQERNFPTWQCKNWNYDLAKYVPRPESNRTPFIVFRRGRNDNKTPPAKNNWNESSVKWQNISPQICFWLILYDPGPGGSNRSLEIKTGIPNIET